MSAPEDRWHKQCRRWRRPAWSRRIHRATEQPFIDSGRRSRQWPRQAVGDAVHAKLLVEVGSFLPRPLQARHIQRRHNRHDARILRHSRRCSAQLPTKSTSWFQHRADWPPQGKASEAAAGDHAFSRRIGCENNALADIEERSRRRRRSSGSARVARHPAPDDSNQSANEDSASICGPYAARTAPANSKAPAKGPSG